MNVRTIAIAAAGALAAIAVGVGYAAIPAANRTISACRDNKGSLKVIDAEAGQTCSGNQQLLQWNQQGPPGPQGPVGPRGPSGVIQSANETGAGANPSAAYAFFGKPVNVTVPTANARVLVIADNGMGTGIAPAGNLNLFICKRQAGSPVTPIGNGIAGIRLPANTRVPVGLTKILQLAPGQYTVGLCGTGDVAWNSNDWGSTTALVFNQ